MKVTVKNYLDSLNSRMFTNNVQRVLFQLLRASERSKDGWVTARTIRVPSAGSRIRDLRLDKFGGFDIDCATAVQLGRSKVGRTFLYKIDTGRVTVDQLRTVFE